MLPSHWQEIGELFHTAAGLHPGERRSYLERHCSDPSLIGEVLSLLEQDAHAIPVVDDGLEFAAAQLFDQPAPASLTGQQFGPYKIDRLLGSGGVGLVFLGYREDLDKQAAIKILRDAWLSPSRWDRFQQEQRTLSQLIHPAIAQLYDAGITDEGTPWFAMEFVDGQPITTHCDEQHLSIQQRLELFRKVCMAVRFAHERAIIHRDLKPANIFVEYGGQPKLLDFGIAKHLEDFGDLSQQTQTGLRMMTPAFAAPEQMRGQSVGAFTDVYSLGILLYILLAGGHPDEIALSRNPPAGSTWTRLAWDDLLLLCQTARQEDVTLRYSSMEALIRDLDHLLAKEPLEARPVSMGYKARKFFERNRNTLLVALSAAALLLLSLTLFVVRLNSLKNDAVRAASRAVALQRFTQSLFDGGESASLPSRETTVLELLRRGTLQAGMLNNQPEAQSDLYQTIGNLYRFSGNYGQADQLLQRALQVRKDQHFDTASALYDLGVLRTSQANFKEAEQLTRRAIAAAGTAAERSHFKVGLGRILKEDRQCNKAIPVLLEAEKELSQQGESLDLAEALKELTETYFYLSSYDIAEQYGTKTIQMHKRLLGPTHVEVADDLVNLASIEGNRGRLADEERDQRTALGMFEKWYGPDDLNTAGVLALYGKTLLMQARYDEARPALTRALHIREKWMGPMHPYVGNTLGDLCRLALMQEQYPAAHACYQRRSEIYRATYGASSQLVATNTMQWADVYYDQKQYDKAAAMYLEVIGRMEHENSPDMEQLGKARFDLARVYEKQKRLPEARRLLESSFRILSSRKDPGEQWLESNRNHLIAVYRALGETELAERLKAQAPPAK